MERRHLLSGLAGAPGMTKRAGAAGHRPPSEPRRIDAAMNEVTIPKLQAGKAAGYFGAGNLVELDRPGIAQVNRQGPAPPACGRPTETIGRWRVVQLFVGRTMNKERR